MRREEGGVCNDGGSSFRVDNPPWSIGGLRALIVIDPVTCSYRCATHPLTAATIRVLILRALFRGVNQVEEEKREKKENTVVLCLFDPTIRAIGISPYSLPRHFLPCRYFTEKKEISMSSFLSTLASHFFFLERNAYLAYSWRSASSPHASNFDCSELSLVYITRLVMVIYMHS